MHEGLTNTQCTIMETLQQLIPEKVAFSSLIWSYIIALLEAFLLLLRCQSLSLLASHSHADKDTCANDISHHIENAISGGTNINTTKGKTTLTNEPVVIIPDNGVLICKNTGDWHDDSYCIN